MDHLLHRLLGDEFSHAVVDPAARQDNLGNVADFLRLVGKVVGVNPDAVPAHEPRPELEEIPLGAGRLQHIVGVDAEPVENKGQFVHEGNIQVALGVFDNLCGLGHLDARRPVNSGSHHRFVNQRHGLKGLRILSRHHLFDLREGMLPVAGVDPFGAVADRKIPSPNEPRHPLQHRHALILGNAGVDRRFIHDDIPFFKGLAHCFRRLEHQGEIGLIGIVHRRRHRNDMEIGLLQLINGIGKKDVSSLEIIIVNLPGPVIAFLQLADANGIYVKTNGFSHLAECHCHRKADITETNN